MKVLIAVSSKEFSAPTLSAGMKISQSFKAMATIAVSYTHLTLPTKA